MASDEQSKQSPGETPKSGASTARPETAQSKQATGQNPGATAQAAGQSPAQASETDAITLLKNDHREVEKLFAEYEKASSRSRRQSIIEQVTTMLKIHSELEESIFYPAVRQQAEADDKLDEAQVEHDTLKILIADLEYGRSGEFRDAKVKVLSEYVKHHVQEEEASGGILEQGRKGGLNLQELGQQMAQLKEELAAEPSRLRPEPVSLQQFNQSQWKEQGMMRQDYGNGNGRGSRDRDERGRFTESRGGPNDERRQLRGRGYEDDYGSRSPRSASGYARNESDRGENRGGWSGDSRGHSEAVRRGWDERERAGSERSGSSYEAERQSGGSRRGGQGSGWHGDPEGHSEAARRGWQHRDDDRSSRSRASRDEDDERGYYRARMSEDEDRRYGRSTRDSGEGRGDSRGPARGGWFGDPRGHSEAARRGWEERR